MTPSVDVYACSNLLLCSEEVLEGACDGDGGEEVEEEYYFGVVQLQGGRHCDYQCLPLLFYGDCLDVDDSIAALARKETQHMPRQDYLQRLQDKTLDAGARQDAVSWLLKVQAHYSFGPLTAALAVNYLDRFLSRHPMPTSEKAWMFQLVSVACLSLAAKIEETEVPLLLDLQVEGAKFIFEPRTIQRMEVVILSTLEWRLHSVTPFSYIDLFVQKLGIDGHVERTLVARYNGLVLNALQDIRYLAYRPSVIAAASTFQAIEELIPGSDLQYREAIMSIVPDLESSAVGACLRLMEDDVSYNTNATSLNQTRGVKRKAGGPCVPASPSGVLDASFGCDSESTVRSLESSQSVHLPSSLAAKKPRTSTDDAFLRLPPSSSSLYQ